MNSKFSMKMLLVLIAIFLIPAYVFADEIGKITYIEGRVDTFKQNDKNSQVAREYDTLSIGDSIRTKSNSKAEIKFKDGTILRLAQNSKIRIEDYQFDQNGKRKRAAVALERGKVRTIIAKMPHSADFDIITPNAKGVVKGSDIFAFYQAGSSGMLVAEGALSVVNTAHPGTPFLIPSGNSVLIPQEKLPEGPRPYLDLEEKLHEQDTNIPFSAVKSQKISTITAQIAKFQGEVKILTKGQASAHPAKLNEVLMEGDEIQTGANALAEIRLDNANAINLKPNTKLLIVKLVFNPQTKEYENIFEVTVGKVKARVEGIKGKSKFEIKTPLAICGVRGTILYVNVSPDGTTTLVEGGNGYITSLISGITQNVGSGENSSANGQGGVTNPVQTSQGDREGFTEGWDIGNGTEGYSAPGGTTSITYNTNTGTNNDIINTGTGEGENQPVDVPVTESGVVTENPSAEEPITLNGAFTGAFGFYEDELYGEGDAVGEPRGLILDCGTINNGVITATGDIWAGSSQPITLSADFNFTDTTSNHDLDLWATTEDFNLAATTTDGSTIVGLIGGIKNSNYLKGISYSIYIKPDGSVGYIKSTDLSGSLSDVLSGTLALSGTITTHQMGMSDSSIEIQGFSEDAPINGKVAGDISGVMDLSHTLIKDQNWGLWRMGLGGSSILTSLSNKWSAVAGGKDEHANQTFRFLVDINGTSAGNNELFGTVSGIGLDYNPDSPTDLGYLTTIFDGEFRGIYDNEIDNWWEALAVGAYTETPLTFGANFSGNFGYCNTETGAFSEGGSPLAGSLGGTDSLWAGASQMYMLGEFSYSDTNHKLWRNNSDIMGHTSDGGTFLGGMGGININDSSLKGIFYAFYIRPDPLNPGNYLAGYMKSTNISGSFYPEIWMFQAEGTLNTYLDYPTTVFPSALYDGSPDFLYSGTSIGKINGSGFSGFSGDIFSTTAHIIDQPWSLWRSSSAGNYRSFPTGNWIADMGGWSVNEDESPVSGEGYTTDSYWFGTLSGNTNESNGSFSGIVDVTVLGQEELGKSRGELLGVYGDGSWEALSAGTYGAISSETIPLTAGGIFNPQGWGVESGFDFYGYQGLTGSVWNPGDKPNFISIGEFSSGGSNQVIWLGGKGSFLSGYYDNADVFSNDVFPGAFFGLSAGRAASGSLKGFTYALYINPSGDAGIISGEVSGDYIDSIGMYKLEGSLLTGNPKAFELSIPANELYNHIYWDSLVGSPEGGSFGEAGGEIDALTFSGTMLNIDACPTFGVWNLYANGYYTDNTSDDWQLFDMTGFTKIQDTTSVNGAWLGGITGSKWSGNEIGGTLDAIWVVSGQDGTLSGRTITGKAIGNYIETEGDGYDGTWQAGAAGEWIEIDTLVATNNSETNAVNLENFSDNLLETMGDKFVKTTIDQMITGETAGMSAVANLNLYAMNGGDSGIWAAIINGYYSTSPTAGWSLSLSQGANNMLLSEGTWSADGHWTANVSGSVVANDSNKAITGQASGTYTPGEVGGAFSGVGTGTYQ